MKKLILTISTLIMIAILVIGTIFAIAIYKENIENEEVIIGEKIIKPDRIVYRSENGNYYQFQKDTTKYNEIIKILTKSITSYKENGKILNDEEIDKIHETNYIEFDYKTVSKNYIIQLEKNDNQAVIKLADTGGEVFTENIKNVGQIKKKIEELAQNEKSYNLDYKSLTSRNILQSFEYKYIQQFKEIKSGIYQIKISDIEEYERYKAICNLSIDEEINEETFQENDVILTVSLIPKISVKVNIGNIKYEYDKLENIYGGQYTSHVLIVSKIVNTDCIYNKDLTEIENKVQNDNLNIEYNNSVDNIDANVFVTDFEKFMSEYQNSNSSITQEQATEIAEKGFKEAERVCGKFDEKTQKVTTGKQRSNNFFTRKTSEGDKTYGDMIEVYVFTRVDDMELNGVSIYVDKKLGKIIGGGAFGD